jgi:hypothetical protein
VVPRSLSATAAAAVRMREPLPVVVVTSAPHHAVHLMANGGGGGSGMSKDSDDQDHHLHNSSMNGLMVLMDDDSKRSNHHHHHVLYGMNDSSTRLSHLRIFYAEHCIYLLPVRYLCPYFIFLHHSSWFFFPYTRSTRSTWFSIFPLLFHPTTHHHVVVDNNRCWVGLYFQPPCRRTTNTYLVTHT